MSTTPPWLGIYNGEWLINSNTPHRQAIDAALDHGLSQGLIESTNTKIRLLTRIAFGFRSPEALIALAMLALGGHRPALPGRTKHPRISQ
jgi:transposase